MNEAMKKTDETAWARGLEILKPDRKTLEHGLELHRQSLVFDSFGFAPYPLTGRMVGEINALNEAGATAARIKDRFLELRVTGPAYDEESRLQCRQAWEDSGVTATMQTCGGAGSFDEIVRHLARFFLVWDRLPGEYARATCAGDARRAWKEGRRCQFISLNGLPGEHIRMGPDAGLNMVDNCYNLGCRMMHLTYNLRNLIGDGCVEPADAGLSGWGREVVERMNRVGIIPDTAHSGRRTTLEAAEVSSGPVAASHTTCQGVYRHDRGKSDEEIRAIAKTGGLVGICAIPSFLGERANIGTLLDHLDHLVGLVGPDHAAIGTDVACEPGMPEGMEFRPMPGTGSVNRNWRPEHHNDSPEAREEHRLGSLRWTNWPLFTVGLVQRGHSDDDIRKIIGGNVLRVLEETAERAARN